MGMDQFWECSIIEIQDYLESYERRERREMKERLTEKHYLAQDIAQYIHVMLNGQKDGEQLLEPWDFFPELFGKEGERARKSRERQDMAVYKAQMRDFAYRHNHARNGGEKP